MLSTLFCFSIMQLSDASFLTPPVLPLVVRNPYLSAWLPDARNPPWQSWPMFWTGQNLGLSVMVSVPDTGTLYPLLGRPQDSLSSQNEYTVSEPAHYEISFDATTTNLTYVLERGRLSGNSTVVTVSFLSPITPSSTFRQSLPASYFTISVQGGRNVNIYSDINGEWVSGDYNNQIIWELQQESAQALHNSSKSWKLARQTQQIFTETADRSEWGTLYFTGPISSSHQAGSAVSVRQQFAERGRLSGQVNESFRGIHDDEPVFAFSTALDPSTAKAPTSVCFTIALVQDPVVQFAATRGLTLMRPLWASYLPDALEMVQFHYADFRTAFFLSANYSQQLQLDALKLGPLGYDDVVHLSARQVLGATQFSGTPDSPLLFLKEISSNGNFQTVDVIFPSFPFFLYTNPRWLAFLLEPLIEHQLSGQYPNNYSMHDLGSHFPNATGHSDGQDEYMPVEECGDMLIMGLAVVNAIKHDSQARWPKPALDDSFIVPRDRQTPVSKSGAIGLIMDGQGLDINHSQSADSVSRAWVKRAYTLWKRWTGYLVRESLIPRNQLCTDDFAGRLANQTNLALKGIIAIRAMSEISELADEQSDAREYKGIAEAYISQWQELGISRDGTHAKLAYDWYGSWTTLYNLFADALLCFHSPHHMHHTHSDGDVTGQSRLVDDSSDHFVPTSVYEMQSKWYLAVTQRYGLPLDSRHLYAKSDWEFFAAAVASKKTRETIITSIMGWVNETVTDRPLTDLYDTEGSGDFSPARFMARPVVGGHFAPLALERACHGKGSASLRILDEGSESPYVGNTWAADTHAKEREDGPSEL